MNLPKYDGNIHPDEWVNDFQHYFNHKEQLNADNYINYAVSLVDHIIKLPAGIDSFEKLRNALKEDISFTVFKITNKRKLQLLRYIPEKEGGETSKFISNFRKLCYNAEINDIGEQRKFLIQSLPNDYFLSEFFKRRSNVIKTGSIVALKHAATGKYLSSISGLNYTTGSNTQLVFANNLLDPNALWNITFTSGYELAYYTNTNIYLRHNISRNSLGIFGSSYCNSPVSQHTEVSCNLNNSFIQWNVTNYNGQQEYLRSHDFQFTIGNDTFQEVACHNDRLGGNDE
ncbi:8081_t:CDS:2, partial [Funneliformis caledonium]